jgi:hypothetical protein
MARRPAADLVFFAAKAQNPARRFDIYPLPDADVAHSGAAFAWEGIAQGECAMSHLIEFCANFLADQEISPKHRLERLRIRKGMQAHVDLLPHVIETPRGPVEVADIGWRDGSVTRNVPFRRFRFVD